MSCSDFQELISDALGNEISDADRATLDRHLATCTACRTEFQRSCASLAALRAFGPPPEVTILRNGDRLTMEPLRKTRLRRAAVSRQWLRYAACIVFAFIAGYFVAAGRESAGLLKHGHLVHQESPSPSQRDLTRPAGTTLEAAIAAVHLQHPDESPLTKCLLALATPKSQPNR